ncbi:TPA: hypothetical protein N2N50_000518 [Kluyvera ascorbata]|nr:hypothetical protein STW0522KLE44_21180 [Klebsiella sp. STW0522-44]HAT7514036.1 hypothetical protein [Kluyvera ascorbata]HCL5619562.1 hypothetical protein [Kluyvera ascorbata]HED3201559.1 hypothetical protein [Kluyvera ascorbata]HED4085397.1 hypothetical protein [Kluyvera ascorbata]
MTSLEIPTPTPLTPTCQQLAIQYFEAVLTRDSQMLRDTFGYSKQECDNISPSNQEVAATKLMVAGNTLSRKTPAPVLGKRGSSKKTDQKPVQATVTKLPTFNLNPSGQKFG